MRRVFLGMALAAFVFCPFVGCAEKTTETETKTVTTPEGETTVTKETEVKKSGENPPETPR